MRGKFITVEGIEGVGKTTNITFIKQWFAKRDLIFVATREPGGTPLAEDIRNLLLSPREESVNEVSELLLMFASRAQHIGQVIEPALSAGEWVLCDRFTDATYAYQGGGRGQDVACIRSLERIVQRELRPDLTFILDLPVEVGLQRAHDRSAPDRFERERHDFFERVRQSYLDLAKAEPGRCKLIDASQSLDAVQQQIATILETFLAES